MENQEELWLPIPEYEGLYEVSNWGRVKSIARYGTKGGIMKQGLSRSGYYSVGLLKNSKRMCFKGHQLVAMAFLGHKPCGYERIVDHIDGNKLNNHIDNLQIVTQRENMSMCFRKSDDDRFSELRGVYKHKNKLRSAININGRQVSLGSFIDEQSAHDFYICANANLNKYENDIQFQKLLRKILNYEDGRIFDHEHVWYSKSKNKWFSEITKKGEKIFNKQFDVKENAVLCSSVVIKNISLYNGDKKEFSKMIIELYDKQKEGN